MSRIRDLFAPESEGGLIDAAAPVTVRQLVRRFWPDAHPYRRWLPVALLLIGAATAITTAEIWLFKLLVDDVLVPGDLDALLWIAVAYLALTLVGGVVDFADSYLREWISSKFVLRLRCRLFDHVRNLPPTTLGRRRLGDLMARIIDDVRSIETFVLSGLFDAVAHLLRIVLFTGALLVLDWQLALLALIVIPVFYGLASHFSRLMKRTAVESRRRSGSMAALTEQSLANLALVQASNRGLHESARFRQEGAAIVRARLVSTRIRGVYAPLVDLVELAGVVAVLAVGVTRVAGGDLTVGGLLVFLTYLTQLYSPVRGLGSLSTAFFTAAASGERVVELLEEKPFDHGPRDLPTSQISGTTTGDVAGTVSFEAVSATYPGESRPALVGARFTVARGQTLAVVGPSGAGKSTLVRLLLRFLDPSTGTVRLDGQDIRELDPEVLRRNVAVLQQDAPVLHETVCDNIRYATPDASEEEVRDAARAAGALDFIENLPAGFDTVLGHRGTRLSGGQCQRIAIARALLQDAPVLVLDEPLTGLDQPTATALLKPLHALAADRTTIWISHDPTVFAANARVLRLEPGSPPREVPFTTLQPHRTLNAAGCSPTLEDARA